MAPRKAPSRTRGDRSDKPDCNAPETISDDLTIAQNVFRQVAADINAPAAARVQAARTLAEMAGALGRNAKPPAERGKPLAEMTRAELEAELAATEGED